MLYILSNSSKCILYTSAVTMKNERDVIFCLFEVNLTMKDWSIRVLSYFVLRKVIHPGFRFPYVLFRVVYLKSVVEM